MLYMVIKEDIQNKIKNKVYNSGDKLPTELELSKTYNVSRGTIQKALNILVNLGYIYSIKRIGYFVAQPKNNEYITKFDEMNIGKDVIDDVVVLKAEIVNVDEIMEYAFPVGSKAIKLCRLFYYLNMPVGYEEKYLLYRKKTNLNENDLYKGNSADVMTEYIMNFSVKRNVKITACAADDDIANYLKVQAGYPIMFANQVFLDRYNRPFGYCHNYYKHEFSQIEAKSYKPSM